MKTWIKSLLAASALVLALPAHAAYPDQPVRVVVSLGPGSATDAFARMVAESLRQDLKTNFIVENRPGAGGTIAGGFVARGKPDGYTIAVFNSAVVTTAPAIMPSLPYNPLKDFTWLGTGVSNPIVLGVGANSRFKTLEQLIAAAKQKPGSVTAGIIGIGSHSHFNLELLNQSAGIDITRVPYSAGTAPIITGLIGGEIDSGSIVWAGFSEHVRSGKIRLLGASSPLKDFPDVPTFASKGYPQANLEVSFMFAAPPGLPKEVTDVLVPAIERAVKDPKNLAMMENMGFRLAYETPAVQAKHVEHEFRELGELARQKNIKAE